MVRCLRRLVPFLAVWMLFPALMEAQQPAPLTPQEHLDRVALELAYTEREHKLCRQSLADMWARANVLEKQVQELTAARTKLLDELKGFKEPPHAPSLSQ